MAASPAYCRFSATPFLVIFGVASLWLRGFQYLSLYVLEPAIARFTGRLPDVSVFAALQGNVRFLLVSLLVAWTLAAVGEEVVLPLTPVRGADLIFNTGRDP